MPLNKLILIFRLSLPEMVLATQIQIHDEAVYISLYLNAFGKYTNPLVLLPAVCK